MNAGVKNTPIMEPNDAFSSATASLPPDCLVMTMTIFTVIGSDAAITMPSERSFEIIFHFMSNLDNPYDVMETNPKLKI